MDAKGFPLTWWSKTIKILELLNAPKHESLPAPSNNKEELGKNLLPVDATPA